MSVSVNPITEDPVERIRAIVKDLFLTPGPSGGQLYSINEIIRQVNKKEPEFGRMVTSETIYEWAYERTTAERPTWVELMALAAKLNLKPSDRIEDRTWEETIYQKMFEIESLNTNEQMVIRSAAIGQINTAITAAHTQETPVFRDTQEALFALSTANAALAMSYNPMTLRTVMSGSPARRKRGR